MRRLHFIAVCLVFASSALAQPPEAWVRLGSDGKLVYKTDSRGNRIPDFSNCGYGGGGVSIPEVPVKAVVAPGAGDAGERIQAAIDQVSKLPADARGFRGTVLLKRGKYPVAGQIRLETGGVVLRGEGLGIDGTVLVATGTRQRSLIVIGAATNQPTASAAADDGEEDEEKPESAPAEVKKSTRQIIDEYVPVNARSFHVNDAAGLQVGQEVTVKRPSTAEWIHEIGMDRIPQKKKKGHVVQWQPGDKDLNFNRVITRIAGNEITVDAPICNALEKKFGGGQVIVGVEAPSTSHVGVENLRGDSEFKSPTDEEHGWNLIELVDARNVWVRKVIAIHFGYSCVKVEMPCKWVTIEDCACLDPVSRITGGRRYSFALRGQLTLVKNCYARNGRHDFVMHSRAPGPNVFLDCKADNAYSDSGPHHRWSAGVLYDNVVVKPGPAGGDGAAGDINIRNRGSAGTGHGWAGANQVLWNCTARRIICEQPPTAQNWAIGCIAEAKGDGYWEAKGHHVVPRSLYLTQLRERLAAAAETQKSVEAPLR